jgi:endonuclease/exonuclease/phosphatase family metal-dependent hydrolase
LLFWLIAHSLWLPAELTVLTWNTGRMGGFAKPEKNEVLQYLLAQDADVVCLQEVDVYKDARYLTLAEVKQTLGRKYPYSYLDFSVYDARHQYGTMVWSRYPLTNKQSIRYETRGNLSNRCDIIVGKDTIRLINNHLESYSFTAHDMDDMNEIERKWRRAIPLRNKQAQTVRAEIEASPYPVVVVGDFNSVACSYAYLHISRGLYDAWNETHFWEWGATFTYKGIGLRIDYILCSDPLRPVSCDVPDAAGSDHKPVVATMEW